MTDMILNRLGFCQNTPGLPKILERTLSGGVFVCVCVCVCVCVWGGGGLKKFYNCPCVH